MKRVFALMLAAVLCVSALAGCAAKPAPAASAAPSQAPAASKAPENADWKFISGNGKLTVGITLFAPMNYKDDSGKLIGFETEFATAVAKELGVTPKFQEIEWATKEIELNSKNIDCIWNGMTVTDERKANMDFSVEYMANKQVMVVKAENVGKYGDLAKLKGANVVAEKKSAGEDVIKGEAAFKDANYTPVASQAKVLMEVAAGTADVGVIDYVMTIGSIGKGTDFEGLSVVPAKDFAQEKYGIAFRKGSPETVSKVDAAIQKLADNGTLKTIAEKYKLQELLLVKPK